jgi:UDP-N-acetylmuramoyl-L-alanyl-D-glutamate--2,6-diaminopimelate ligase
MRLSELLIDLPDARVTGDAGIEIASIAYDSRVVTPGALFVALRGGYADGHRYVEEAARRGAVAALVEEVVAAPSLTAQVIVGETRAALARVAARFHGEPSRQIGVIGVTGTDGKTTTTYFLDALLTTAGLATGLIGTVDIKIGADWLGNPSCQTTPSRWRFRRCCAGWSTRNSTGRSSSRPRTDWRCTGSTVSPTMWRC